MHSGFRAPTSIHSMSWWIPLTLRWSASMYTGEMDGVEAAIRVQLDIRQRP